MSHVKDSCRKCARSALGVQHGDFCLTPFNVAYIFFYVIGEGYSGRMCARSTPRIQRGDFTLAFCILRSGEAGLKSMPRKALEYHAMHQSSSTFFRQRGSPQAIWSEED